MYKHLVTNEDYFLNIISGNTETCIFINSHYEKEVLDIFLPQELNLHISEVGAISIKFDSKVLATLGVVYQVLKYLVWENINLLEVISTYTELTLIIEKVYANRAIEILTKNLISISSQQNKF